jgi:hypothetical protein
MIRERIAAIFIYCPRVDMSQWGVLLGLWGTYETNLLTNEGYRRNERLNASFLVSTNRLNALPLMFTFCGKNDAIGWQEKIVFYDSLSANKHGGFHFWSMTDHPQTYYNSPWQPSFPNFSFFTRYRTNLSYPAFTNCSINDNPGNGNPSNGASIGSINGHLDWNDDIVDTTNRWEITLKMKDLSTIYGSDPSPDSATTDVTLRRLQAFRVPTPSTINWENRRNNIIVQHASFAYDSGPVTIPGVKVYKDSSRLAVWPTLGSVADQENAPREYLLAQNYPNPFNPSTTIKYELPKSSDVRLNVFDILGREVSVLVNERRDAGVHEVKFDATGLSSGVYFYRLRAGNFVRTKKLLLMLRVGSEEY